MLTVERVGFGGAVMATIQKEAGFAFAPAVTFARLTTRQASAGR